LEGSKHNPFLVPPTYHFWAPWIGPRTRSDILLSTEFAKVHALKSVSEVQEITVTEDRLTDELSKQKVCLYLINKAYLKHTSVLWIMGYI